MKVGNRHLFSYLWYLVQKNQQWGGTKGQRWLYLRKCFKLAPISHINLPKTILNSIRLKRRCSGKFWSHFWGDWTEVKNPLKSNHLSNSQNFQGTNILLCIQRKKALPSQILVKFKGYYGKKYLLNELHRCWSHSWAVVVVVRSVL